VLTLESQCLITVDDGLYLCNPRSSVRPSCYDAYFLGDRLTCEFGANSPTFRFAENRTMRIAEDIEFEPAT
jgi:hypothetical protein